MLTVTELTKEYGSYKAVDRLSFSVRSGELVAFLGMNGAGKTTTIRMLTGILQPTSGTIEIGGYNIATHPIEAKQITGYVPDRPYLYPKLTPKEYLQFVGRLYNVETKRLTKKIAELLSNYSIADKSDSLIESLSHGMRQRLATCGSLLHEPKVLIVDEPMVGLDPRGAQVLKKQLKSYAASGMAVLLSTHSLHVAEEIADTIYIIHQGSFIAHGTLQDIRNLQGNANAGLEELFLGLTEDSNQQDISSPSVHHL